MLGLVAKNRLPQSEHTKPALREVGVLRLVERDAPALPRVWLGEAFGVTMPVVAVKLNDEVRVRDEGVDAELPGDEMLPQVEHAGLCEKAISAPFVAVGVRGLLRGVHRQEALARGRVRVATRERTVRALDGRRTRTRLAAHAAIELDLGSPLPLVRVLRRAEVLCPGAMRLHVRLASACCTRDGVAAPPHRLGRAAVARESAVSSAWTRVARVRLAASSAHERADLVPKSTLHSHAS